MNQASKICLIFQSNHGMVPNTRAVVDTLSRGSNERLEGGEVGLAVLIVESDNDQVASSFTTVHRNESLARVRMAFK